MRERSTSAMMETAPAISAALGCAPLIPPKPEEINKLKPKSRNKQGTKMYPKRTN